MAGIPIALLIKGASRARAGVGADFALRGNLFLRTELLYGIKLPSSYESRMAGYWEQNFRGMSNGVHVRLALGYTFR
ncbi:MAG: hypothetical protein FWB78_06810 [Treponema sp.]|nr:hypothetical protein [Treponema sp.]